MTALRAQVEIAAATGTTTGLGTPEVCLSLVTLTTLPGGLTIMTRLLIHTKIFFEEGESNRDQ